MPPKERGIVAETAVVLPADPNFTNRRTTLCRDGLDFITRGDHVFDEVIDAFARKLPNIVVAPALVFAAAMTDGALPLQTSQWESSGRL